MLLFLIKNCRCKEMVVSPERMPANFFSSADVSGVDAVVDGAVPVPLVVAASAAGVASEAASSVSMDSAAGAGAGSATVVGGAVTSFIELRTDVRNCCVADSYRSKPIWYAINVVSGFLSNFSRISAVPERKNQRDGERINV